MKYLHRFKTTEDFNQEFHGDDYKIPWVSVISANTDTLQYNKTKEQEEEEERQKLLATPLTFVIQSNGVIRWKKTSTNAPTRTIEYNKNGGEWTSIISATGDTAPSISVVSGDTVQFRGNNPFYATDDGLYNCFSGSTCSFSIKCNIMSMINSTNFANLTNLSGTYTFYYLFSSCTGLTDASNLLLPATTLAERCYYGMFSGCTSLVNAPGLPATTLAERCYGYMFEGCTSLTQAPELPATTLAERCYNYMFEGCTSLTTAPALPATTLAGGCYISMFRGCTNLTTVPSALPATALTTSCYSYMFEGCTSLTQAPVLPAETLANYCYDYMFQGCTSLVNAPALPATTLVDSCYRQMFRDCTNLKYIKCLATDISAGNCTYNWVSGVASTGTFVKPASTDWSSKTGSSGIPSGWTVQDAS